jgi:CDP-6-deoxy-D-xylo-4-hexulose-3-dehydrase
MKKKTRHITYGGALIGDEEVNAILKTINKNRQNWQLGEEGRKMEAEAAKFLGVKHAVLTNSGSSAGLLALSALELPKGSEVIIPATTFPTIFNIILQCGLTPVVVDSKVGTYNLDPNEIEKALSPKTKAVIAVHAVGNPVDMPALMKVAKKHGLYVIEDNCDGWGSTIGGKKVGSFGHISITSFHAAHIVSMGVGGGVFTDDPKLMQNVRMYRDWGRQADLGSKEKYGLPDDYNPRFIYEKIGYNFQILELQAAMGRVQLKKAGKIKQLRAKNFAFLYKVLKKYEDFVVLPKTVKDADICWFAFPLSVKGGVKRGDLVKHLEENGIETRSMFAGNITRHPAYKGVKYRIGTPLTEADIILKDSLWVSVHPRLTNEDRAYMQEVFETFFDRQVKPGRKSK